MHCAILKALHDFQEKRAHKSRDMQFFLQNFQNEIFKVFKMFKNMLQLSRAACWINSIISKRNKINPLTIYLFCHYCSSLLWCNYWISLKSDSHFPKKSFIYFNEISLKIDGKWFLFHLISSAHSQDII